MMRRFLSSHCGPGVDFVGEGGLERFALQSFLCGRLDAAELMQERMVCGTRPDGIRLIVLALMARLHAGHPRATGDDLVAEAESILSTLPENVPPDFDIASHREIVSRKSTEIVLSIHSALDLISASPGSFAPLFGAGEGDPRPLVCIEKGAFSFARLHAAQRDLVDQISRRAVGCAPWTDERIAHAMSAVDALPGHALHPDQRAAVERSLHRPFLVLTGGPGTGKTTVVSRILLALSKVMDDFDPESVGLCAPTGRAKARLAESIGQNLASLSALDPVAASLSNVPAATLHSLLGALPNGTFRHHPGNPLPHRVVVLDEASMVDLPLFAAFLEALSPSARVILVGDPDQLPSVDAGPFWPIWWPIRILARPARICRTPTATRARLPKSVGWSARVAMSRRHWPHRDGNRPTCRRFARWSDWSRILATKESKPCFRFGWKSVSARPCDRHSRPGQVLATQRPCCHWWNARASCARFTTEGLVRRR
jgi:hypothetical protein